MTLRIQPWPIHLVPPGNFRRHSIPRLCLPIQDNFYHSPRCFSFLRSFPIWAGIHTEINSLLGERLYLSRFTKEHKKKENNAFKFLKAIVFFILLYMYLQKCVDYKKKERKWSYETYSFVRKCDRSNWRCKGGNYHFLVILTKKKK